MPRKAKAKPLPQAKPTVPKPPAQRKPNGTWAKGYSGSPGADAGRARRALNADTIREMHAAFNRGGRQAIDKVMKSQPAIFLKLLVLLVPRELEITQTGGAKGMSDEQIDAAIEAIKAALAKRAGDDAKVVDASPVLPQPLPLPENVDDTGT